MTQLMLTFKFEAADVNFQQFWTFLTIFKIFCCLTVFVVSEQVLNELGRFCTTLIKIEFFPGYHGHNCDYVSQSYFGLTLWASLLRF